MRLTIEPTAKLCSGWNSSIAVLSQRVSRKLRDEERAALVAEVGDLRGSFRSEREALRARFSALPDVAKTDTRLADAFRAIDAVERRLDAISGLLSLGE